MILIKDELYDVRDLDDVAKLVRDNFDHNLADRIEDLSMELSLDHISDVSELQEKCDMLEDERANLEDRISTLEDDVESLQDEIKDLNDQIDYWSGIVIGEE